MKKIFSGILVAVLAFALALPFGFCLNTKKASAAAALLSVLPTEIDDAYVLANVDGTNVNTTAYTPYEGSGNRMSGDALLFDGELRVAFDPTDDVTIDNQKSYSVYLYLFLPDVDISRLTVRLESGDANSDGNPDQAITWVVESGSLYADFEKPISGLLVPGWRRLELPFVVATPTLDGVQNDPVFLSALNTLYVNAVDGEALATRVGLFDVNVTESSGLQEDAIVLYEETIESYGFISTTTYYNNFAANRLKNDKVQVPAFSSVFGFAWVGGQKIETETGTLDAGLVYFNDLGNKTTTTDEVGYRFQLKVSSPSGVKYYNLNTLTSDTYSEVGTYYLQLVLRAEIATGVWKDVALAQPISVKIANSVNVVWFETTTNSVEVGYTYKFYFAVNSAYYRTTADKIEVTSSNPKVLEIVKTEYDESGKGYVEVKALKKGKAKLALSSEFTRIDGQNKSVFEADATIGVTSPEEGENKVVMIVLWCVLGAGAAGALAYGIYAIVKHNKMQIK